MQQEITTYRRIFGVFKQKYHGTRILTKARHLAMTCMIDYTWMVRNKSFFQRERMDVKSTYRRIQSIHNLKNLFRFDTTSDVINCPRSPLYILFFGI